MIKKTYRQQDEHSNHERWLVSYADFITLLFAFFVVMYSLSPINEGKYRVLSDSIGNAFKSGATDEATLFTSMQLQNLLSPTPGAADVEEANGLQIPMRFPEQTVEGEQEEEVEELEMNKDDKFSQQLLKKAETEIDQIGSEVENQFEELVDEELLNVKRNKFWLEVEIKSKLLFNSGSSDLLPQALPVLEDLANLFVDKPNRIHIEGFTDNKPIRTRIFPSNWELSAARAATVVRLFEGMGIAPQRMASIGYGEYQPVADNNTEEGRAKNRRVVMVVMAALEGNQDQRIYDFDLLKSQSLEQLTRQETQSPSRQPVSDAGG